MPDPDDPRFQRRAPDQGAGAGGAGTWRGRLLPPGASAEDYEALPEHLKETILTAPADQPLPQIVEPAPVGGRELTAEDMQRALGDADPSTPQTWHGRPLPAGTSVEDYEALPLSLQESILRNPVDQPLPRIEEPAPVGGREVTAEDIRSTFVEAGEAEVDPPTTGPWVDEELVPPSAVQTPPVEYVPGLRMPTEAIPEEPSGKRTPRRIGLLERARIEPLVAAMGVAALAVAAVVGGFLLTGSGDADESSPRAAAPTAIAATSVTSGSAAAEPTAAAVPIEPAVVVSSIAATDGPERTAYSVAVEADGAVSYEWSGATCGEAEAAAASYTWDHGGNSLQLRGGIFGNQTLSEDECDHDGSPAHPAASISVVVTGETFRASCTYEGTSTGTGPPCEIIEASE